MLQLIQTLLGKGNVYPLLKDGRILRAQNCTKADFDKALESLHGEMQDAWAEGGSHFACCLASNHSYYLSFHEKTGALHIAEDARDNLAPLKAQDGPVAPLVTQGRLLYYAYDCGMLYVIRLSDGRFVVIDGGMAEYEEPQHFLDILNTQNVLPGVPQIAAWFITHAHDDHFSLFVEICSHYSDRVKIDTLVYNWAAPERIQYGSKLTGFDAALQTHPEIKVVTPHTGMRFAYPRAEFSILYTHEDRCPDKLVNFNDTSTVMRMDCCGQRIMWTGDCMWETADWLCANYDESVLKCEFLQVAHHGYSGGSDAFYRAVDADILLWPCPDFWFYTQSILPCNRYLLESPHVKATFMSGREETVIDMTKPVLPSNPYEKYQNAKTGDVLFESDFSTGSIFDLGWSAITGGRTNYASAALSLMPGGLRMIASPDRYSVLELMQPGMLTGSYTMEISILAEKAGTTALFWNYDTPWEYDESQALDLGLPLGQDVHITLQVCCESGQAIFTRNGKTQVIPFTPARRKGLYLILKDSVVVLRKLQVVR